MRENVVEKALVQASLQAQGRSYKWVSPGVTGVPDRIVCKQIPPEHQSLVAQYIRFVELKAPGAKPQARQLSVHGELKSLGFVVSVIDTQWAAQKLLEEM